MILTTQRLILREFVADDWRAVLAYQQDPRYLRFYAWTERTPETVQSFVAMFLANQQAVLRLKVQLAVTLKQNGQLIGNCGIRRKAPDAHEADIGFEVDPNYWGHGYATEAARAVVAFGFEQLRVHRIWAWCIAENTGSARVLEKVGMRREGVLRDKEYFKNRWWDTTMFAILDHEWQG